MSENSPTELNHGASSVEASQVAAGMSQVDASSTQDTTATTQGHTVTTQTTQGRTIIADSVVAKIAGYAARHIEGVANLGSGTNRVVDAFRDSIQGLPALATQWSQGVRAEVTDSETSISMEMVVEFGYEIPQLTELLRAHVTQSVERATGLRVRNIDLHISDIAFSEDSHGN